MQPILIIADPINTWSLKKDSTVWMMHILAQKQHPMYLCTLEDVHLTWQTSKNAKAQTCVSIQVSQVLNLDLKQQSYTLGKPQTIEITQAQPFFKAALMRKDPPYNLEYVYACHQLSYLEQMGIKVCNASQALKMHSEKLSIFNFSDLIVPSLASKQPSTILKFVQTHQQCIIKPLDAMGGAGVFKLSIDDVNLPYLIDMATMQGTQTVMVQTFIAKVSDGDKRILIMGDCIVEHGLARIPKQGSIRANLASGGHGEVQALTAQEHKIAQRVQQWMHAQNIFLAGIDVIGGYLNEINITSPTCFQEIASIQPSLANIWYDELVKYINR